jgi:hypothetical protein
MQTIAKHNDELSLTQLLHKHRKPDLWLRQCTCLFGTFASCIEAAFCFRSRVVYSMLLCALASYSHIVLHLLNNPFRRLSVETRFARFSSRITASKYTTSTTRQLLEHDKLIAHMLVHMSTAGPLCVYVPSYTICKLGGSLLWGADLAIVEPVATELVVPRCGFLGRG